MKNNKHFTGGALFTITNYIWWFLQGNFYFFLTTIPFWSIITISAFIGTEGTEFIMFISSISMGPALVALLNVMNKLIKEGDIELRRQFFKAYKTSFLEGIYYWILSVAALLVIYLDIIYIKSNNGLTILHFGLLVLAILILSMTFYIFPIVSVFYFKFKDVIKLSFIYSIKKIHITLLCFASIWAVQFIIMSVTSVIAFFMASIICYSIMSAMQGVLYEIEKNVIENKTTDNSGISLDVM